LENFEYTTCIEDGQYIVYLPRKKQDLRIPTNYCMYMAHLMQLLQRTPSWLLTGCQNLFAQQEADGIIERVPSSPTGTVHYLPYKPIWRKERARVVHDASAKTKTGQSLNDQLHAGPSMINNLVGLLIGFRLRPIVLLADIEKMFLMIGLDETDCDLVRFLWVEDPTKPLEETRVIIFHFGRLPFG